MKKKDVEFEIDTAEYHRSYSELVKLDKSSPSAKPGNKQSTVCGIDLTVAVIFKEIIRNK